MLQEPLMQVLIALEFKLMNSNHMWFSNTLFFASRIAVISAITIYASPSFSDALTQHIFVYGMLLFMHFEFSLHDEAATREAFFSELKVINLKDSLEQTLDSLPEPLIVCQKEDVVYTNKAFVKVITREEEESNEQPQSITKDILEKKKVRISQEAKPGHNNAEPQRG